jgi:hypothetical protein
MGPLQGVGRKAGTRNGWVGVSCCHTSMSQSHPPETQLPLTLDLTSGGAQPLLVQETDLPAHASLLPSKTTCGTTCGSSPVKRRFASASHSIQDAADMVKVTLNPNCSSGQYAAAGSDASDSAVSVSSACRDNYVCMLDVHPVLGVLLQICALQSLCYKYCWRWSLRQQSDVCSPSSSCSKANRGIAVIFI